MRSYNTRQRDIILRCLKQCGDTAVTAARLADLIRENGENIGDATVYRNLERLCESGAVMKLAPDGDGSASYKYLREDGKCVDHCHIKCLKCGKVEHLDCEFMKRLGEHIEHEHGFTLDSGKTVIYGVCDECRATEDKDK